MRLAERQDRLGILLFIQIEGRLEYIHLTDSEAIGYLPLIEIAQSDPLDLSLSLQLQQGLHRFFAGRRRVGPMHLVEIDLIRSQTSQTLLDLRGDPSPCRVEPNLGVFGIPLESHFGRDNDPVASAGFHQRLSHQRLGPSMPVHRCRVDELIPRSMAVRIAASDSRSWAPPQSHPPMTQVPNPMTETLSPVWPSMRYSTSAFSFFTHTLFVR